MKGKKIINFFIMILVCFIAAQLIKTFFFMNVVVSGHSMNPNLTSGQTALSDKFFFKLFGVNRFDIVTIEYQNDLLVKRMIAMPNEKIKYENNKLYINGTFVEENFLTEEIRNKTCNSFYSSTPICTGEITLKENEYFVMGDNRSNSSDSRIFGTIQYDAIQSKGLLIYGYCTNYQENSACEEQKYSWPSLVGW